MLYKGSEFLCYTLDPGILDDGLYNLEITYSPKFNRKLPHVYNEDFSKSRGFRIHPGNSMKDSNGCILVGNSITYTFTLVESKKALERVLDAIKDISWLVITTSR
jgi:hypothetical protein